MSYRVDELKKIFQNISIKKGRSIILMVKTKLITWGYSKIKNLLLGYGLFIKNTLISTGNSDSKTLACLGLFFSVLLQKKFVLGLLADKKKNKIHCETENQVFVI